MPRQEIVNSFEGMTGDTVDNVAKIHFRIEAVELGRFDDGVDGGGAVAAGV